MNSFEISARDFCLLKGSMDSEADEYREEVNILPVQGKRRMMDSKPEWGREASRHHPRIQNCPQRRSHFVPLSVMTLQDGRHGAASRTDITAAAPALRRELVTPTWPSRPPGPGSNPLCPEPSSLEALRLAFIQKGADCRRLKKYTHEGPTWPVPETTVLLHIVSPAFPATHTSCRPGLYDGRPCSCSQVLSEKGLAST